MRGRAPFHPEELSLFGFSIHFARRSLGMLAAAGVLAALWAGPGSAQTAPLDKRGAEIDARLTTALNSKTSPDGTPFTLLVTDTLFNRHPELKGAVVDGHLENVVPAAATHRASMSVIFDDIRFAGGASEPIFAVVRNVSAFEPKTHHLRDAGIILGAAVVGHMASKHTGHAGGTLAGAAAGFAIVSALKSDIAIRRGTLLELKLTQNLPEPA
jgi:hypothetical protein